RRGWFTGIEHRREALDRLLPTIRATKDPIQRELYLSLVSERSGVGKAILEQEIASRPEQVRPEPMASTRPPQSIPTASRGAAGLWSHTEEKLLRLILVNDRWRATAMENVPVELLTDPVHQEMLAMIRQDSSTGVLTPPPDASLAVKNRWQSYVSAGAPVAETAIDAFFEGALDSLEARPHMERLLDIQRALKSATGPAFDALRGEQESTIALLRARHPKPYMTIYPQMRKGLGKPPGRARSDDRISH
ncbi:MAG: hypothetical protein JNM53_12390, partial [Gemmatimonadetes bacterium]|nr:hypothetical protein [Gemmatimonadota bacterium]